MIKHTSGPWNIGTSMMKDRCNIWSKTEAICSLPYSNEVEKSNAELIATAPELLEALEGLLREEPLVYEGNIEAKLYVTVDALNAARDAIAKARGDKNENLSSNASD